MTSTQTAQLQPGPAVRDRASLLEMIHPEGAAPRTLLIGSGVPASVVPHGLGSHQDAADLVVLAPAENECSTGWLKQAAAAAARALATDGLVYIHATPRWRPLLRSLLGDQGLVVDEAFLHWPSWRESRYLVSLRPGALAYAYAHVLPLRPWQRRPARLILAVPAAVRLLAKYHPGAALVARRPASLAPGAWLAAPAPTGRGPGLILSTTWRSGGGTIVVHRFDAGERQPSAIVKTSLAAWEGAAILREAENLARLGPQARAAGARVPEVLAVREIAGCPALVQTRLAGESAARLLGQHPGSLATIVQQVVNWLGRWQQRASRPRNLTAELLERAIFGPLQGLAPELQNGAAYAQWLQEAAVRAEGAAIPGVAAHLDLTMANVLIGPGDSIGVIDWETAQADSLPLVDFYYAVADAAAAAAGYRDRAAAFGDCYSADGRFSGLVVQHAAWLGDGLNLAPAVRELCFHACWLHHAFNEQHDARVADGRPFLQVLQRIADNAASSGQGRRYGRL